MNSPADSPGPIRTALLFGCLGGTIFCLIVLRIFFIKEHIIPVIILLFTSGCFYAGAVYLLFFKKMSLPFPVYLTLFATAFLLRIMFINTEPEVLSDDVYRYLWDGKVQQNGINPYLHTPDSEKLQHLRDRQIYPLINHKEFHTSYPPVSQFIFRAAYRLGVGSLLPFRMLYLMFEGTIILFLLLYNRKIPERLLIYLLCPLVIIETYAGLHIDIAGAAFFIGGWFFYSKRRYYLFILFFTLSVLTKYISIVAAPLFMVEYIRRFVRDASGQQHPPIGSGKPPTFVSSLPVWMQVFLDMMLKLGAAAAIAFVLFLPFLRAGGTLFLQAKIYAYYWEFNGGVYSLLRKFFGTEAARRLQFLPIAASAGVIAAHPRMGVTDKAVLTIIFYVVLSSTVYPWYLLWFIPFLVLRINKSELALTVLITLSYYVRIRYLSEGIWEERTLFFLLQYIPFFTLFIHDILRGRYVQREKDRCNNSGT